ncbi:glycosyltransferase [Rhizobium pusense]|nr:MULTISPECIES: glycosyltransferase [Rhizobium/Agrobacterium group]MDH2092516.1 glycosyltransferase [Agrobacterium pusense]
MNDVTLIIPSYNYGNYIEDAIDSVLEQTEQPERIFVIDDCSTDSTRRVLQRYSNKIELIYNDKNLGIVENFRKAVNICRTEFIAFVGADNIAKRNFVYELRRALARNQRAAVAYFDMEIFGPKAEQLAAKVGATYISDSDPKRFYWSFPDPTPEALARLETDNFMNGSSMFRRSAYEAVGGYRQTLGPEDADLFLRMVRHGYEVVRVPEALIMYRQHSLGQANTALLTQKIIEDQKQALEAAWAENEHLRKWAASLHEALVDANNWARHLELQLQDSEKSGNN